MSAIGLVAGQLGGDMRATILRFPPYVDLRKPAQPTFWQRLRAWFSPPPKAPVFRINNPAQWKLERARRKARGNL